MDDEPLYSRAEFAWFLAALGVGMAGVVALGLSWWLTLIVGLGLSLALLPVIGLVSRPFGRLLRFLLAPIAASPAKSRPMSNDSIGFSDSVHVQMRRGGEQETDPDAGRIIVDYPDGTSHTRIILPPGSDDLLAEYRHAVEHVAANVARIRAVDGSQEVARWRPGLASRIRRAWTAAK